MKIEISKDWCLRMASLEGDTEIGAGVTAADPLFDGEAETQNIGEDEPSIAFGRFVRLMRRDKGLTLEELAEQADIDVAELVEIEDDVRHIIPDARNRGELVENAIDSDGGNRSTFERRQQHAAQAVAERRAVTALERLADELAVAVVFTDFRNFNFRFLDVYHLE